MKMRVTSILAFALLSVSILSYGVNNSAFAANSFITASVDSEIIGNGGTIELSGSIEDYDATAGHGLTFIITSPDNNIVGIGQISVKSDGSFEKSIVAGGPLWKLAGDYTVDFNFGPTSGDVTINYVGGEQVVSQPDPEPEPEPEPEPVEPTPEPEPEPVEPTP
ncbi:MAG: hypothetical protein IS860_02145, partial [Nitrosopumilus sp.]|nr:hypothetical protein [Nitrosopumilus sp.]